MWGQESQHIHSHITVANNPADTALQKQLRTQTQRGSRDPRTADQGLEASTEPSVNRQLLPVSEFLSPGCKIWG